MDHLESSQRESPLPVLVLIHGDDYGWGGANPYNGTQLAAQGQIIVVALNYRLGVYGRRPHRSFLTFNFRVYGDV